MTLILYFMIYSFMGWCVESSYVSLSRKQWVNSGFLRGPFIPIYGFGALLSVIFLFPYRAYPLFVFLMSMIAMSILEYFTSWLLEQGFHIRFWDYSHHLFHLHGRICVLNSIMFGILSLILVYIVHPWLHWVITILPLSIRLVLSFCFLFYLLRDGIISFFQIKMVQQNQQQFQLATHLMQEQLSLDQLPYPIQRFKTTFPNSKIKTPY